MSKLATSSTFKLPTPTMGVDWSVPLETVQYPYSPFSFDWIADGYKNQIRSPHSALANTTDFYHLASYEKEDTIIATIVSGGSAGIYEYFPATETRNSIGATLVFYDHVNYQGRIFLATSAGAASWDGTTLSTTAFTGASGSGDSGCCIYRDRYIHVQGTSLFFAPTAGAIAGALSTFNLASYYSFGTFSRCAAITVNDSNNLADFLIITSTGGDILAFTGDFPGSANWQLVVKTKIDLNPFVNPSAAAYGGTQLGLCKIAGDAYLFAKNPAKIISAKELIQSGVIAAEQTSPISKIANLLRDQGCYIRNVTYCSGKNALLVETVNLFTWMGLQKFTNCTISTNSIWFYVDLLSGAISPFTYPENGGSANATPYFNKTITHSDGYVYSISDGTDVMYRLLDDTDTTDDTSKTTCLVFPYTDLEVPDVTKTVEMIFPVIASETATNNKEARVAVRSDYDSDSEMLFSNLDANNYNKTQRLVLPAGNQGVNLNLALVNYLRPTISCQSISLQFEQGGPY